jgi:hypothetical protein
MTRGTYLGGGGFLVNDDERKVAHDDEAQASIPQ